MHTGYDNYWIYQNSRPVPLLSLPISDIIHAGITDNYIQGQNGELSSHFKAPQSKINSCQNDYRMTGSQNMGPPVAYRYPFRTSYANNIHLQNISTQVNHPKHSSQKNHIIKNNNVNFGQSYNRSNYYGYIQNESNKTTNGQSSRIQVKKFFSLSNNNNNNNNNNVRNFIKEGSLFHQREAHFQFEVNNSRTLDCDFQPEYMDYGKLNLAISNQHLPISGSRAVQQNCLKNQQKYIPSQEEVCNTNFQFSSGNQFNFSYNDEVQKNSRVHNIRNNSFQILKDLLSVKSVEEGITQNKYVTCNALQRSKRVKINPKKNASKLNNVEKSKLYSKTDTSNNTLHSGFSKQNEKLAQDKSDVNSAVDVQNHPQESCSNADQSGELQSHNSACSELRKFRKIEQNPSTINSSSDQVKNPQSSMIKITIPHTGQSSFINFNDPGSESKSQNLSLPCLLDSVDSTGPPNQNSCTYDSSNAQVNQEITLSMLLTDQRDLVNNDTFHHANATCSTSPSRTQSTSVTKQINTSTVRNSSLSNEEIHPEESIVDINSVEKSLWKNNFFLKPNILSDNSSINNNPIPHNVSTENVSFKEINVNHLKIKQEHLYVRAEAPKIHFNDYSLQDEAFYQNIKSEKNCYESIEIHEQKMELPLTENSNLLEESSNIDADDTENIDVSQINLKEGVFHVKKTGPKAKTMSTVLKDAENRIKKPDEPTENSTEEENLPLENKANLNKNFNIEKSYKSQINRDKLDLLIQFLKKDEEAVKVKNRFSKKIGGNKTDLNHNRRKPNKTCIVKNKNNSREMVSLVSHKTPRMETNHSPSKISGISQADENCNRIEEKESPSRCKADNIVEKVKSNESSELDLGPQNIVSSSESQSKVSGLSERETSEKNLANKYVSEKENNLMSVMKGLQKFKTHFCLGCGLVLSVDSFWINVVSRELKCFSCLKKIALKSREVPRIENKDLILSSEGKSSEESVNSGNNSENEDRSKCVSKTDFGGYNNDQREKVETAAQNVTVEKNILCKHYDRQVCIVNCKKGSSQKNNNLKDQKISKVNELLKSNKSKESVVLKTKGSGDSLKPKTIEACDDSFIKKTSAADNFDCTDKIQNFNDYTSPSKSRKNSASENCGATKSPVSRYSESSPERWIVKNMAKESSNILKSPNKIDILENYKSETTNKPEKSHRKIDVFEMKKKGQEKVSINQDLERNDSEEFSSRKIREENRNKEIKGVVSPSFNKNNSIANCLCDKNCISEEVPKKSTKYENLDKIKTQNCSGQKQTNLGEKRNLEDDSLQNRSAFNKSFEMSKKNKSLEQSRKRKNLNEDHGAQKVRILEHSKKAKKFKTNLSKVNNVRNKMEKKKSNSVENSKKHKLFKETYDNFEIESSKEAKLELDFLSERTKKKSVLKTCKNCKKPKLTHSSKGKANSSTNLFRRSSQKDFRSLKIGFSGETSEKEVEKSAESPSRLKKNYSLKEEQELFKALERSKKESKPFNDSFENQKRKKTDNKTDIMKNKKINGVVGKIPKIAHSGPNPDDYEIMRSPLNHDQPSKSNEAAKFLKELENVKTTKDKLSNSSMGVRTNKKKEIKVESHKNAQKEKNIHHSEEIKINFGKNPKIPEENFNGRKPSHGLDSQSEKREEYYFCGGQKKNTFSKECRQSISDSERTQSADLVEKLLKKQKNCFGVYWTK